MRKLSRLLRQYQDEPQCILCNQIVNVMLILIIFIIGNIGIDVYW